jgi:FkbM family methyltransferase
MSFSIRLGNFLYHRAYWLYRPLYAAFKSRQDALELSLLKQHIKPGSVVLDIGANTGFYAARLSRMAGTGGKVHCFEPDKQNFERLRAAVKDCSNVTLYNKAAGQRTENLTIYLSGELNVDHRTYKPERYASEETVEAVAIDDLFAGQRVDFIKMDIQGYEPYALAGMKATLAANPKACLLTEFWPYGLRHAGSSAERYFSELVSLGFSCRLLGKSGLEPVTADFARAKNDESESVYYNLLAVR